ncbi:MAG: class I SAM-dependent methyltransferase [Pseudomonadota bacterium]
MNDLALLVDLHRTGKRQGPGGDDATRLAIRLSGLADARDLTIADVGCGSGASTFVLAHDLDARVTAVDLLPEFLAVLEAAAQRNGLGDRIETLVAPMDALPFGPNTFDAIWSEGAVYTIGFENGIRAWRRFLKPGGILAVSELTWFTQTRPAELEQHWLGEYAEVATAAAKLAILERNGYAPLGYFVLPERCWLDEYYRPLQARFADFLARHGHSAAARSIVDAEQTEIDLYERFSAYFGYGYYVARKTQDA